MRALPLRLSFLLLSAFSISSHLCIAQMSVSVLDSETLISLENVEVFNVDFTQGAFSDEYGTVALDTSDSPSFHFTKEGYTTRQIDLKDIVKSNYRILLSPLSATLDELVLIAQSSLKESDQYHQVKGVTSRDIALTNPQTSADVLRQHGDVYVQKSQMGGGSPIIRGFEANRVLMVVDGVRMNNAIYRNGHLQNAITIDASVIEEMNVYFGPNSLAYGSDAIGGVVAFKTKTPRFSSEEKTKVNANSFLRYASANEEKTIHADVSIGMEKFAFLTSLTVTDYDDLTTGDSRDGRFPSFGLRSSYADISNAPNDQEIDNPDPNVQIGTAYHQYDFTQKVVYKAKEKLYISGNLQLSTTGDVPRYDNLQERSDAGLRYAEWYYGPQNRTLASVQVKNYKPTSVYDKIIVTGAYQYIEEDRIIRNFGNPLRYHQNEDVHVYSISAELEKSIDESTKWLYGLEAQHNSVISSAFNEDTRSGTSSSDVLTRYADGANLYTTYGAFAMLQWAPLKAPIKYSAGVRYSGNNYTLRYQNTNVVEWPLEFTRGINGFNNALTWSISGVYNAKSGFFTRALLSSAFRAPNIDDLSKIRVNNTEITFPNPKLSPEKSVSGEISFGMNREGWSFSSTTFFTSLKDAIIRAPFFTPEGAPTYSTFGESLNVVANSNVQKANVYGTSLSLSADVSEYLRLQTAINYTKGTELIDGGPNRPFAHIPPLYGQTSLVYEKGKWLLRMSTYYNGAKDISQFGGTVDNPDLATPIGSLSWMTYNIHSQYQITQQIVLTAAVENIMDKHYRVFSSGVSAPGRNLILSIRSSF